MDQGLSTGAHQDIDGLRERNTRVDSTVGREALTAMGEVEIKDKEGKDGKELKTFGRTPDGTGKPVSELYLQLNIALNWIHPFVFCRNPAANRV